MTPREKAVVARYDHPLDVTYRCSYMMIRFRYGHPDPPVLCQNGFFAELVPPKDWSAETYSAYHAETIRLTRWYTAACEYAGRKRKTPELRAEYEAVCDRERVDGKGARFEGEAA
jgi:hypothetical protein